MLAVVYLVQRQMRRWLLTACRVRHRSYVGKKSLRSSRVEGYVNHYRNSVDVFIASLHVPTRTYPLSWYLVLEVPRPAAVICISHSRLLHTYYLHSITCTYLFHIIKELDDGLAEFSDNNPASEPRLAEPTTNGSRRQP